MSSDERDSVGPACVIAIANEKGGSGKSTVAMHVAVALLKRGKRVATVDLDCRQRSLSRYVENRRTWSQRIAREFELPEHVCFAPDDAAPPQDLAGTLNALTAANDFVVIDTPGHDGGLMRQAHTAADILITPLNDSFVDLDTLGAFDAETLAVAGPGHYAATVDEARRQRREAGRPPADWIVLRNRLSMTNSRNKRQVDAALQGLSAELGFRYVPGLAERVIYRELFLRGLTALDDLDLTTLGARPTLSHVTARQEIEQLLESMNLDRQATVAAPRNELSRDAA